MLNNNRLAVIIPALNEEATIANVVACVSVRGATPIVVDDGSLDQTANIARSAGALVVSHEVNNGYEQALNTGIHEAAARGFELAATFDADGQLDPDDLVRFVDVLDAEKSDLVIGVRDYRNRYTEYLLALFGRLRFGLRDPLCGLKLYRLKKAKHYFPFDTLRLVGMEMSFRMLDAGCKVTELPIHVQKREGVSRYGSSFSGELNILKSLWRVIWEFGLFRIQRQRGYSV
ncbi:MAG: glycosyltransferase family 2 protein [Desulfobulbaceae bacterium]|nr:glycosyltransferase family 2 protein [Desulfobulbaceae bacterium]